LLIDFDLLKAVALTNRKPEVELYLCDHLEKSITDSVVRYRSNLTTLCRMLCGLRQYGRNRNRK